MTINSVHDLIRAVGDISQASEVDRGLVPRSCRIAIISTAFSGIISATNLPSVVFEGEDVDSGKTYQVVNPNYFPKSGDRVIMLPVGRTYVIIGPITSGVDTGWKDITSFSNSFTADANAPKARQIGNSVELQGAVDNSTFNTGTFTTGLTLPASVGRPTVTKTFALFGSVNVGARVLTSGDVQFYRVGTSAIAFSLDVIRFRTD